MATSREVSLKYSFFGRAWLVFACICLLLSGALALVITFAKMPGLKDLVENIDLIRWCLMVHVNLATLVWFTAFPVGLSFFVASENHAYAKVSKIQILGFLLSIIGVLLFITSMPSTDIKVIMANYIPVMTHLQFYLGLSFYCLGVLLSYMSSDFFKNLLMYKKSTLKYRFAEVNFGIIIGATFYVFALLTFLFSLIELINKKAPFNELFFEKLMWGPGHILQHSSSVFAVVSWLILSSLISSNYAYKRKENFTVFAWLGLPLLIVPFLLFSSVVSETYQYGFTFLMQWGIGPPILFVVWRYYRRMNKISKKDFLDYKFTSLLLSIFLMLIGIIFGGFIRGSDLRIPGHYHAVIGSVTLAYMSLSYTLLALNKSSEKWMLRSSYIFTLGQILFSGGMFTAGLMGIERKTYGSEHTVTGLWMNLSFVSMAIGGLLAFTGGIFFALAILPHLKFKRQGYDIHHL